MLLVCSTLSLRRSHGRNEGGISVRAESGMELDVRAKARAAGGESAATGSCFFAAPHPAH